MQGRDDALAEFVDDFAARLAHAGWPPMPAKVFVALLVANDQLLTAAELGEVLQVSPAAVSGAVRYLEQLDWIVRERLPTDRRDRYRLSRSWYEMFARRDDLFALFEQALRRGVEAAGADTPLGLRLVEAAGFFSFLRGEFAQIVARWNASRSAPGGQPDP